MTLAQSNYETFWRLASAAYRADQPDEREKVCGDGYAHALKFITQEAVHQDADFLMRLVRESRENVQRISPVDFWYDGYIAGCDRAIHILQGGM
jgi:hypothetical protein